MTSKTIEEFLNFLHDIEQKYAMAIEDQKEADNETQDILHAIELNAFDTKKTRGLVKTLQKIRKRRRTAKETIEIYYPVLTWVGQNRSIIKSLERLLGDVRKVERRIEGRTYSPKTTIMENY